LKEVKPLRINIYKDQMELPENFYELAQVWQGAVSHPGAQKKDFTPHKSRLVSLQGKRAFSLF